VTSRKKSAESQALERLLVWQVIETPGLKPRGCNAKGYSSPQ
jgi:hypothetical protein